MKKHNKTLNPFMPCPSTGHKIFWAGPNDMCKTKKIAIQFLGQHSFLMADVMAGLSNIKLGTLLR